MGETSYLDVKSGGGDGRSDTRRFPSLHAAIARASLRTYRGVSSSNGEFGGGGITWAAV
jgi:hypothetical protein